MAQKAVRESTNQLIIWTLRDNPAYLLLFAIGLLGGGLGVGSTTVGLIRATKTPLILGFLSWVLLLVAAFLVIIFVERRRREESELLATLDQKAREAFLAGRSAASLSGLWKVKWYIGEGEQRRAYEEDPEEEVSVSTFKSRVSCSAHDPSTGLIYWMDGRLSEKGIVTLTYWGQPEKGVAGLTGVVFLIVDDSFESKGDRLTGWWRGFTRDGKTTTGEVEWIRLAN
jgi:hypothetical protein